MAHIVFRCDKCLARTQVRADFLAAIAERLSWQSADTPLWCRHCLSAAQ